MKRIFLFLVTNIAIMLVITIIINIFGLGQVLDAQGVDLDLTSLLMLSAVVGGTGSFISLAMSKSMAKHSTGAYVITQPQNEQEQWLINTVSRQAQAAGIGMPEVAIYDSPDINAFATGMLRSSSRSRGKSRCQWRHGDPCTDSGCCEHLRILLVEGGWPHY